jgi:hypothetical protein
VRAIIALGRLHLSRTQGYSSIYLKTRIHLISTLATIVRCLAVLPPDAQPYSMHCESQQSRATASTERCHFFHSLRLYRDLPFRLALGISALHMSVFISGDIILLSLGLAKHILGNTTVCAIPLHAHVETKQFNWLLFPRDLCSDGRLTSQSETERQPCGVQLFVPYTPVCGDKH